MKDYNKHQDPFANEWQDAFEGAEMAPSKGVWEGIQDSLSADGTASAVSAVFEDASFTPSEDVWDKVSTALAEDEAALYKRRMRRYQYLSAAAIALLLLVGGQSMYQQWGNKPNVQLTGITPDPIERGLVGNVVHEEVTTEPNGMGEAIANAIEEQSEEPSQSNSAMTQSTMAAAPRMVSMSTANGDGNPSEFSKSTPQSAVPTATSVPVSLAVMQLPSGQGWKNSPVVATTERANLQLSVLDGEAATTLAVAEAPAWETPIYTNPDYMQRTVPQQQVDGATPYASLGMSSGMFSPNYSSLSSADYERNLFDAFGSVNPEVADDIDNISTMEDFVGRGVSVSTGLQFGLPLGKRWMLQSGASVMRSMAKGSSNYVYVDAESGEWQPTTQANFQAVNREFHNNQNSPYGQYLPIVESYTYASVPLQVAYLVSQGKVDFWVQGGVSADVFLKNRVAGGSEADSRVVPTELTVLSENSPFQPVLASAVVGTDVSYQLTDHWSVAVQPAIKMSMNSIVKQGAPVTGRPAFLDVGVRLKYHVQ